MTPRSDLPLRSEAPPRSSGEAIPAFLGGGNEHPLIDIPFTAYVDGRQHTGEGISLLEAHVVGLADPALENQERLVRIAFDFGGFAVSIQPQVRILRHGPQRLVLRFADPTGDHLPQLRHILNEYIAGDYTSLGTVIRAGGQGAPRAGARVDAAGPGLARRLLGTVSVVGLSLALLVVAATLAAQKLLVTRLAEPGVVVLDGETLRAVADGQVTYLDPEAPVGEVAFAIASVSGETLSVAMPCDCEAVPAGIVEGATVLAGEPVLTLVEGEPTTVVRADVPAASLFPMQEAGGAEIRLADGGAVFGALVDHGPSEADEALVAVRLAPATPIPVEAAGQAVELRIRHPNTGLLDRVRDGRSFLAGLWAGSDRS